MDNQKILKLADTIIQERVKIYGRDQLPLLLRDIQRLMTRFCDSFCEWAIMEGKRFEIDVTADEEGFCQVAILLNFPFEVKDIEVTLNVQEEPQDE